MKKSQKSLLYFSQVFYMRDEELK